MTTNKEIKIKDCKECNCCKMNSDGYCKTTYFQFGQQSSQAAKYKSKYEGTCNICNKYKGKQKRMCETACQNHKLALDRGWKEKKECEKCRNRNNCLQVPDCIQHLSTFIYKMGDVEKTVKIDYPSPCRNAGGYICEDTCNKHCNNEFTDKNKNDKCKRKCRKKCLNIRNEYNNNKNNSDKWRFNIFKEANKCLNKCRKPPMTKDEKQRYDEYVKNLEDNKDKKALGLMLSPLIKILKKDESILQDAGKNKELLLLIHHKYSGLINELCLAEPLGILLIIIIVAICIFIGFAAYKASKSKR
jgi:hypothetical protein